MTRFTLTVLESGHLILSTPEQLHADEAKRVIDQFEEWRQRPDAVALIAECQVQHAKSVEIDLGEARP